MAPLSNDTAALVPRTDFPGGRELRFDLPGLEIGVGEYEEGPTGCTVFHFPRGASCATDVRGGSPGVLGGYEWVRAICFAGGSLYGLEAGTGVAAELLARADYEVGWTSIAPVSAAIVFDFRRGNAIYPDKELGRAAVRAARPGVFPLGARGAGRSVTVGKTFALERGEPAGQGGAFRALGPTRIAVFTVVNAFGAIVDRDGAVVRGHLDDAGSRLPLVPEMERAIAAGEAPQFHPGNTTLTLVVTNQRLERRALQQLGRQVHASMARALQPFHALVDGDVLYAATTNEVDNPQLDSVRLGVVASELAWDAVLCCFD
ncbi:MAG TPA: P1 family peptidase [Gaiellaceae bacterium]|nr:P1 family peptidase [Gaiellaceae bacterium]